MQPYAQPFRIAEPVSNNVFSWEFESGGSLYVPACVDGTLDDLAVGDETVFCDLSDDKKSLLKCRGLDRFVRTTWNGIPVAVMDNHNHALYFWYEARARGHFSTPVALVHVDEHSDKRPAHVPLAADATPAQAFQYANRDVNVGNFIQPLLDSGFLSSYQWIADEAGCERVLASPPTAPYVLDFDADFFSPNLDYMDWGLRVRATRELARRAAFITVATSPFFIDQERAIKVIREVLA